MYTIIVEMGFYAVHQVRLLDGTLEELHGHDWMVRAHFMRAELDDVGMVLDYDEARSGLESVLAPLRGGNLNDAKAFAGLNPTAEIVATHVFEGLLQLGFSSTRKIEVTEAPGCIATFEPERALFGAGLRAD